MWPDFLDYSVSQCTQYFFTGAFVQQVLALIPRERWRLVCVIGAVSCAIALFSMSYISRADLLILPINGLILLVFITSSSYIPQWWNSTASAFGNLTYSSYLLHFPIQMCLVLFVDSMGWERAIFSNLTVATAYIGTTFAFVSCRLREI
jgi:peptidoglycan/LPS O-acetylase OafA/YrhL